MTRSALALFVGLGFLLLAGCQPAGTETNRNLAATNPAPAKEAFDPAAIEAELMRLEREWAGAAQNHNAEAVKQIMADDIVLVYPDGTMATKADEVRTIESGAITADTWEMLDTKVTVIDADAAFITGRSLIKNGKYKDPGQKRPLDISGEYRFLDLYARRGGKWVAVASQATKIANPTPAPSPAASVPPPPASGSPTATASPTP